MKSFNYIENIKVFEEIKNLDSHLENKNYIEKLEIYSAVLVLLASNKVLKRDNDYYESVHNYIIKVKEIIEEYGYCIDRIYGGITGVGFAILAISDNKTRYVNFLNSINELIFESVKQKLNMFEKELDNVKESYYDVISGISGDIGYLLNYKNEDKVINLIKRCLSYLVKITEDVEINSNLVPRFFIKQKNSITEEDKESSEIGFINQGLAHGIPSILNSLSLTLKDGINVEGQENAIEKIIKILCEFKYDDIDGRTYWYSHVSFEQYISKEKWKFKSRESWCYGTIGIAKSLYDAAKIIKNIEVEEFARKALIEVAKVGKEQWDLDSVSLCHGYSSILVVMTTMYRDTGNEDFKKAMDKSYGYILNDIQEEYIFKFKDYTYSDIFNHKEKKSYKEDLGILTGAIGVFLSLGIIEKPNIYLERMLLLN